MASLALDRIVRDGLAFDPEAAMPDPNIGDAVTRLFERVGLAPDGSPP